MSDRIGPCRFCKQELTTENGVLVDETGGDVCGVRSADTVGDNLPHAARRACLYVDESMFTPNGYIPSYVTEDEAGHSPMVGNGPHAQPWYFGKDIATAKQLVDEANARLGVSPSDAVDIVMSSMAASRL